MCTVVVFIVFVVFFFSSRRRHTRCLSDWSSDVCSSDLFEMYDLRPDETGTSRFEYEATVRSADKDARFWLQRLLAPRPKLPDRKSTRLNSSHLGISYAVFCLKKKKKHNTSHRTNR